MGIYLGSVENLKFELDNLKRRFDNSLSNDEYLRNYDNIKTLNDYINNPRIDHFISTLDNKKYTKEKEKLEKKCYKNIIRNKDMINSLCDGVKDVREDIPYTLSSTITTVNMISEIKYFLRGHDKLTYKLFQKMLDFEDLYEDDNLSYGTEEIYDKESGRSFLIFKNSHDLMTEAHLVYALTSLSLNTNTNSYGEYKYLDSYRDYKALLNELLFLDSMKSPSKEEDIKKIWNKLMMKERTSASKVKKILDSKDFKSFKSDNLSLDYFKFLLGFILASYSMSSFNRRKVDECIKSKNSSYKHLFKNLDVKSSELINDLEKNYVKHIYKISYN